MAEVKTPKIPTVYTTVKMDDGRTVDFPGKRRLLKETVIDADGIHVRLDFVNGETRLFTVSEALMENFAAHGAEQKLGDAIAGIDAIEDCVLAVDNLMDSLNAGKWVQRAEGSGANGASILARALSEVTGKSLAEVRVFLSTKSQAEKVALRQNAKVLAVVQRLEAEKNKGKAKSQVDTDSLLGELTGDELDNADADAA